MNFTIRIKFIFQIFSFFLLRAEIISKFRTLAAELACCPRVCVGSPGSSNTPKTRRQTSASELKCECERKRLFVSCVSRQLVTCPGSLKAAGAPTVTLLQQQKMDGVTSQMNVSALALLGDACSPVENHF